MAKSWAKTKAPSSNRKSPRPDEIADIHTFTADYSTVRLIGPVSSTCLHWIKIKTKEKGNVEIPKACLNYNPETESFDENGCPYCEHGDFRVSTRYYANAIIRELQDAQPKKMFPRMPSEKKVINIGTKEDPFNALLKEKGSKAWTPMRALSIPPTIAQKFGEIATTNRHIVKSKKGEKSEKAFDLADPKYGIDLMINFKTGGSAGFGDYDVQKDRRTPLTEEELEYLLQPIDFHKPESLAEANKEWKNLKKKLVGAVSDDEDDEDEDDDVSSKKSKGKKKRDPFDDDAPTTKSKSKSRRDDYEDEDDDRPAKKSKNKKSAFDDLDEEISRARKKKKSKTSEKPSSKPSSKKNKTRR